MAYPASGFESLYRNPIEDVKYFYINFHILNIFRFKNLYLIIMQIIFEYLILVIENMIILSLMIMYLYKFKIKCKFKVVDYEWEDHHSPAIETLFKIC